MTSISSCHHKCAILSFYSWVLFKKEHVQIKHALLQKIVGLQLNLDLFQASSILKALPSRRKKVKHLQGNNIFCAWQCNWYLRHALQNCCILNLSFWSFKKIMHLENNPTFCSEFCTAPLWTCKHTRHRFDICIACSAHMLPLSKETMGCRLYWTETSCILQL